MRSHGKRTRQHSVPRRDTYGHWQGRGPMVLDAVSGDLIPKERAVLQRGRYVYDDPRQGSLDEDGDER
jgi:hypothetical protein